ncbi:MAG: sigma-70 family RNA polymerase sigma factor [Pirellulales bacterium]|nr:sigma-70 family RNA polymerase sigma factor [Pirellulales bacterium]
MEALGKLLASCQKYLLHIANRDLADDVQAKLGAADVVQETFVQAQQSFDQFHGRTEEELRAWLACILRFRLRRVREHYLQTSKRDVTREVLLDDGAGASRSPAPLCASDPSPSRVAVQLEDAAQLNRALASLPDEQRQIILFHDWDGRSFEEIALQMSCTYDAARKRWARAILALQRQLASQYHEHIP